MEHLSRIKSQGHVTVKLSDILLPIDQSTPSSGFGQLQMDAQGSSDAGHVEHELHPGVDVRESMRVLPNFLQPLLTWLTGKPLRGSQPVWKLNPHWFLAAALLELVAGVSLSIILIHSSPIFWPLLLISWMNTVGGGRFLMVTIIHHCVHYNFSNSKAVSLWLTEVLSAVLLIQDFEGYRRDHVTIHHGKMMATLDDPDMVFLLILGFRPGMKREDLWKRLIKTLPSPRFHYLFLRARLAANFKTSGRYRIAMSIAIQGVVLAIVAATHTWIYWFVAWIFPLTFLYHISALLQFTSEHRWLRVRHSDEPARLALARLTLGRFMGEPVPSDCLPVIRRCSAWISWYMRMIFLHLPCRIFVIAGDLPQHDWHHRHIRSKDWTFAAYARQRDLEANCPGWPETYTEVWGLLPAIDGVFRFLSNLPQLPEASRAISSAQISEILNGM